MFEQVAGGVGSVTPSTGRIGAAKQAYDWVRQLWNQYEERTSWSIAIESTDRLYSAVQAWVLELAEKSGKLPRALLAHTAPHDQLVASTDDARPKLAVGYHTDSQSGTVVHVSGHPVRVQLQHRSGGDNLRDSPGDPWFSTDRLVFRVRSLAAREAVQTELAQIALGEELRKPRLHLGRSYGGWDARSDLPTRPLGSVILPGGQKEALVADLRRFLASEAEYARRGIPYHRGYLLSGPPGVGKSSIVQAVSAHLGLDLWFLSLGDYRRDGNLIEQCSYVNARSVLLLEDVDVFHAARQRDDEQGEGATLAGVLNILDGVVTPHGLITFLTTNEDDALDRALVRPGRIDIHLKLERPTWEQVAEYWAWFYQRRVDEFNLTTLQSASHVRRRPPDSMAAVVEVLQQNPTDARAGRLELTRLR